MFERDSACQDQKNSSCSAPGSCTLGLGENPAPVIKTESRECYFMGPDVLNKSFSPDLIKHLLPSHVKLLTSALPNELGRDPALNDLTIAGRI